MHILHCMVSKNQYLDETESSIDLIKQVGNLLKSDDQISRSREHRKSRF